MIAVVDYGAGNLRSMTNVLDVICAQYVVTNEAATISQATKIILPGVGHFGQLSAALDRFDLRRVLLQAINQGTPYLGICLGMQLLFTGSTESPLARGLGVIAGQVRRFEHSERIPHMGWNSLIEHRASRMIQDDAKSKYFYFAHSYYCPVVQETTFSTSYGEEFSAVIESANIFGVQFHPEKSAQFGIDVVRNFVGI